MSFGFSVGDFIAGAHLAFTLYTALSDAGGSAKEFQQLTAQLNIVHKVLLQVDQLRASNQLAQATINALLFTVNSVNETMGSFLDQNQAYLDSLKAGGSGSSITDAYRKLKWPIQMPDRIKHLQQSLAMMLSAVNCLLSMACYHNTGYNPRCSVRIYPGFGPKSDDSKHWVRDHGDNIKIVASLHSGRMNGSCPDFTMQKDGASFFRPGQIFAAQMNSSLCLNNWREFRTVDFGHLPLEPTPRLKAIAARERDEDRQKRLNQIRALPLSQMTAYCKDVRFDKTRVECLLCKHKSFLKDSWTHHFRLEHWRYYFAMLPKARSETLPDRLEVLLVPVNETLPASLTAPFSADKWITIEDVTDDGPIPSDAEINGCLTHFSPQNHYLSGPIMIQRFVVVAEGEDSSLCLGIHSYARQGCVGQPDPELFSMIHSGKEPHEPLANETGMRLSPIRMKPDHPSSTLPKSARIHFGRAYSVTHSMRVQPIGLVHPTSMETLLDQFEANVYRQPAVGEHVKPESSVSQGVQIPDNEVKQVDMEIVKEVRSSIAQVLGSRLSPAEHQPLRY